MGIVQLHTSGGLAKYIQTSGELVILYEMNGARRQIFLDGRPLPTNLTGRWNQRIAEDANLIESVCLENNRVARTPRYRRATASWNSS